MKPPLGRNELHWLVLFFFLSLPQTAITAAISFTPEVGLRRPVALALRNDLLFVANRDSGSISVIDLVANRLAAEFKVASQLSDLTLDPAANYLFATDPKTDEFIVCNIDKTTVVRRQELKLGATPASLLSSEAGDICFVSLRWAKAIAVVQLEPLSLVKTIALPFAPGKQLMAGSKLIVADAVGGNLALIDVRSQTLESVRSIPGHNIRGLALSSGRLYLTQQILSPIARTTVADIQWGNLIGNHLRSLDLNDVLQADAPLLKRAQLYPLGEIDHGFGDPGAIAATADGRLLVASSGTGQLLRGQEPELKFSRLELGLRPTALTLNSEQTQAYAADAGADEILIIDLTSSNKIARISLGPRRALSEAEKGEDNFYDARISHKGWLSCHSCHTDGHSNGNLTDTLGDGGFGAPKRVLSLLGAGDTGPWAWNGSAPTLEVQIEKSIQTTMCGPHASPVEINALAAYLRQLPPPPKVKSNGDLQAAAGHGQKIFEEQGCAKCHEPPSYTSPRVYDVGLTDEQGNTRFNPPSLRGLTQRTTFLHDGREHSLHTLFTKTRHGLTDELSEPEAASLIAFLQAL